MALSRGLISPRIYACSAGTAMLRSVRKFGIPSARLAAAQGSQTLKIQIKIVGELESRRMSNRRGEPRSRGWCSGPAEVWLHCFFWLYVTAPSLWSLGAGSSDALAG